MDLQNHFSNNVQHPTQNYLCWFTNSKSGNSPLWSVLVHPSSFKIIITIQIKYSINSFPASGLCRLWKWFMVQLYNFTSQYCTIFLSVRGTDGWYNILSNIMKFTIYTKTKIIHVLNISHISYASQYFLCSSKHMNCKQNNLKCEVFLSLVGHFACVQQKSIML